MKKALLLIALLSVMGARAQRIEKRTFVYAVRGEDSLRLDRYAAPAAGGESKPCLLFVFGGGFVSGTRDDENYLPFIDYYARQGYVVVSIDYRLGMKQALDTGMLREETFPETWLRTLDMAVGDLYEATDYVLANATAWGVDRNGIVACGSSAGAITVLMGEYGICNGYPQAGRLPQDFNYAGVISFAGAIFDMREELHWGRNPAPLMLFHGDADRNVPYGRLTYEGNGLFGSEYIAEQLTRLRIPHYFYSAANTDHSMSLRPMFENRYEIDAFLEKMVKEHRPLIIDTYVTPLDAPEVPKNFTLKDYIDTNFGEW